MLGIPLASEVDEQQFILFFLALPELIPIPRGTILSFTLNKKVPHLQGVTRQTTSDAPPIPGSDSGHSFVSIRFWQVKAEGDYYLRNLDAVQKVVAAVKGGEAPRLASAWPATITVAELVTHLSSSRDPEDDPFLRCFSCLIDAVNAYRVSENDVKAPISYERLDPMVMTYRRTLTAPFRWWGPTVMQLDHANVRVADPGQLDSEHLERLVQVLGRLRAGHPFSLWPQLCRDRDYAFYVQGDYPGTVIQAALAVEVLISSILACLLWEETFPTGPPAETLETASALLALDPGPMRAELGKRLGGDWGSDHSVPVRWQYHGAHLRNRVVHLGYRATREEASNAITAAVDLDRFIRERLGATATKHHRTSAMFLGEPGLSRIGAMTKRIRALLDQSTSEPDWVQSFLNWRERLGHK